MKKFTANLTKKITATALSTLLLITSLPASGIASDTPESLQPAGELIHSDYFTDGFSPRNWITTSSECAFTWDGDNECIHGYGNAKVLQTNFESKWNRKWDKFYASFDVQVRGQNEIEMNAPVSDNYVGMWITDDFGNDNDAQYLFRINPYTDTAELEKTHAYYDESGVWNSFSEVIASATLDGDLQVGEDAEWFNMGIRVTEGKLECYLNEKLILASSADEGTEKKGDRYVDAVDEVLGAAETPILLWNLGNWVALDNFEVWTPEFNFVRPEPEVPAPVISLEKYNQYGDKLVLDLYIHDRPAVGVTALTAALDIPEFLTLTDREFVYDEGIHEFSPDISADPFLFSTAIGTDVYPAEKLAIARFTFKITAPADWSTADLTVDISLEEMLDLNREDISSAANTESYTFDPAKALKQVAISELPLKTDYYVGDSEFDLTGGKITAEYWNGDLVTVDMSDDMIGNYDTDEAGEGVICLVYDNVIVWFDINVEMDPTVPGDGNGDGKVSLTDASVILQYITGWEVQADVDALDVSGDGKVSLVDATLIIQYIAGWNVTLK